MSFDPRFRGVSNGGEEPPAELGAPLPAPRSSVTIVRTLSHPTYDRDPLKNAKDQLAMYAGWVFACVDLIATDVRSTDWGIYRRNGRNRDDWVETEPRAWPREAQQVFTMPDPVEGMTWGALLELTQLHKDLCGFAVWHLVTADGTPDGRVVGIEVINPDWLQDPIYSELTGRVEGWRVAVPGHSPQQISRRELIFHRYEHPSDRYRGASPLRAAALAHDADQYLRAYAASFARNKGAPEGVLTTEQEIDRPAADEIRDLFKTHFQGRHEVAVLGKGAKYQPIGAMLKDLDLLSTLRPNRDMILGIYKVPASKLGLQEDANRATGDEADRSYYGVCITPRNKSISEVINTQLLPRLGLDPRIYAFEFDDVNWVDREFLRTAAENAYSKGAITGDEYRAAIGMPPDPIVGNLYRVDPGVFFVEDPRQVLVLNTPSTEVSAPPPVEVRVGQGVEAEVIDGGEKDGCRVLEIRKPAKQLSPPKAARLEIGKLAYLTGQAENERRMKGKARALFSREQSKVVAEIRSQDLSALTAAPKAETLAIDDILAVFELAWQQMLEEENAHNYRDGWELLPREAGIGAKFERVERNAESRMRLRAGAVSSEIYKTTKGELVNVIARGVDEGLGNREIAKQVGELYDGWKGYRAERIARTETAAVMVGAKDDHAQEVSLETGVELVKTWVPTQDDRTRDTHTTAAVRQRNGGRDTLPQNEAFNIGASVMQRPHDPAGAASEVIQCRCVLVYGEAED